MKRKSDETGRRRKNRVLTLVGLTLTLTLFARSAVSQTQPADSRVAEPQPSSTTYRTFYLTNLTEQHDATELLNDLRNMLPRAKVYFLRSQNAISVVGSPDDLLLAQKMLSDLDRPRKIYRLNYKITETDSGKAIGTRRFSLIVASGGKTDLKQGNKIPIVTGTGDAGSSTQSSQVQYLDLGMNIEATVDGCQDGARLHTKVELSSLSDEKSGVGTQDPVIRQTVLEGSSILSPGKPLVLGSLDIPGSTRQQEVEVVSELVQ
jgi:type II secretory pathway component GspD/PulD (secretin)